MNHYQRLDAIVAEAVKRGPVTVAFAAAQDRSVIKAAKAATELGLIRAVLVGDELAIRALAAEENFGSARIIDEPDVDRAALKAVELVSRGEASVLVKGQINSSNFLKAALNPDCGLRSGKILSHLAAFEIPGERKLAFHTDGGMVINPDLEDKKRILQNSLEALDCIGLDRPKVAVLTANEQVNPRMPATIDAQVLVELWQQGFFPPCIVEGPIAMDVAASAEAAKQKGIHSQIAGEVDLFLLPSIEAGNLVGKTLLHYAKAKMAGVILGATHPIVLVSRSDDAEAKLNSIALACLLVPERNVEATSLPEAAAEEA
ncbi:MAG: phosphate butyryltransferase [Sulfuritalea sp.]|nr:phosphate butyryltransferase [Sulfuritalea sp.]